MADRSTLLRRFAPVLLGLVGLIFLIVGVWQLFSLTWTQTTGTVGACTTRLVQSATGNGKISEQVCQVTWQADGQAHTANITVSLETGTGQEIDLRVKGNNAVVASPPWLGAGTTVLALLLSGTAIALTLRSRRATT
jgi:hypothetical protein